MTYLILVAFLAAAFGYFVGVAMVTSSLRDDLAELRRLEDEERRAAGTDDRRVLSARLLATHVEHATHGNGWRQ